MLATLELWGRRSSGRCLFSVGSLPELRAARLLKKWFSATAKMWARLRTDPRRIDCNNRDLVVEHEALRLVETSFAQLRE